MSPNPIVLHEYQATSSVDIRVAAHQFQSFTYVGQTGSGKTPLAADIAARAHAKGNKVLFCVHRKELVRQSSRTFSQFGIPHSFIASGFAYSPFENVYIASADTLRSRRHHLKAALLLIDECHLWASDKRTEMINEAKAHGAKIIGFTATPERLDGRPMRPLFEHMVEGPSTAWLMENGYLSRYRLFTPVRPDFKGLHSRAGDFIVSELETAFDKPSIIGDAIKVYKRYAMGKRTMTFAFSRKHGKHLTDMYNLNGIPAVYIDGDTSDAERVENIRKFADREAFVLVSINLAIEGFDLSAQIGREVPVEAVSLQRPTQSLTMARQMIGRALRKKDEPAIIMDHVGLVNMHGLPDEERAWSLDGREARQNAESEKAIPTFRCTACFYTQRSPFRKCPDCQALVPVSEGRKVEVEEGDLAEVDLDAVRRAKKVEVQRARDLPSLAKVAVSQGHKPGWIIHMMKARGQHVEWAAVERAMREARI